VVSDQWLVVSESDAPRATAEASILILNVGRLLADRLALVLGTTAGPGPLATDH
jgi:hypothetical protein